MMVPLDILYVLINRVHPTL